MAEDFSFTARPSRLMVGTVIFQVLALSAVCLAVAVMLANFSAREERADREIELLGACLIAQFAEHRAAQFAAHEAVTGALGTDYEHSYDQSIPAAGSYSLEACEQYANVRPRGARSPSPSPEHGHGLLP